MKAEQKQELSNYCFKVGIPACEALELVSDHGWQVFEDLRHRIVYEYESDLRAGESQITKFRRLRARLDREWPLREPEPEPHATVSNPGYKPDFWQLFNQIDQAGTDAMIILEAHRNMERVNALKQERRIAWAALRVLFEREKVESALLDELNHGKMDEEEHATRIAIIEEVYGDGEGDNERV